MENRLASVLRRGVEASLITSGLQVLLPKLEGYAFMREGEPAVAGLIHAVTFPRWGGAIPTGSEAYPRDRPWRMEAVLATGPLVFGSCKGLLHGHGPRRTLLDRARRLWRKLV